MNQILQGAKGILKGYIRMIKRRGFFLDDARSATQGKGPWHKSQNPLPGVAPPYGEVFLVFTNNNGRTEPPGFVCGLVGNTALLCPSAGDGRAAMIAMMGVRCIAVPDVT